MSQAVETFEGLVSGNKEYGDFPVTSAGEPYREALFDFVVGGEDLSIPELGIDFRVHDKRKEVTSHYESKTCYDLVVAFVDQATGEHYEVVTDVYKGMDGSYRSIEVTEALQDASAPADANGTALGNESKISSGEATALVSFLGSFFRKSGRELYINSDEVGDLLYDPLEGMTAEIGAYRFVVESSDEEITSESDGWSLGEATVVLKETTLNAEVVVSMGLFLGQDREIEDVTIRCDKASFELAAK